MTPVLARWRREIRGITRRPHLWILFGIFLVHAFLFCFGLARPKALLQFDRAAYRLRVAQQVASAVDAVELEETLLEHAPPGDFIWHGAVLWATGGWVPAIVLVQLGIFGLALHRVYRIGGLIGLPPTFRWLAVIFYSGIPIDLMVPHFVASEAFFNPLIVFGTFHCARYALGSARGLDLLCAGLCFSCAAVTRPEILPWIPVVTILMVLVVNRRQHVAPRIAQHVATFLVFTALVPITWLLFQARSGFPAGFGRGTLSIAAEVSRRAETIEGLPTVSSSVEEVSAGESLARLARAARTHPRAFAREWTLHAAKLMALPDNLDLFRYLGLFEMTGKRAELVHTAGPLGAIRILFAEMPLLMTWLLLSMLGFAVFWGLVGVGSVIAVRRASALQRLVLVLMLSLPFTYLGLRAISQGESRKRSPCDFSLALFAAVGAEVVVRRRGVLFRVTDSR